MAELKKFLDATGLQKYDTKIKEHIDSKDAATLAASKSYSDSKDSMFDPAGSAVTAKTEAVESSKAYTDSKITEVNGAIDGVKKTAEQGVTDAAVAKQAADAADAKISSLKTYVGTIPTEAGVSSVVAYVDKKTDGIATDAALNELKTAVTKNTGDISGLQGRMTTAEGEIDALQSGADATKAKVDTLVGTDTGKSVRAIANEELAAQLIPETADETLNTLKEIADWIQKHPNDAAAMNTAIEQLKTLIGTIPEGITAKNITGYIAEVKATLEKSVADEQSRAEQAEAGLGGRITTLEGKFGSGEGTIESQIEAAKQAAISAAAADATSKADAAKTGAVADAKKYTDTEIGKVTTAADALGGRVTKVEGQVATLEGKAHTHANADVLNGIDASKVAGWDAAAAAKHTHANAADLDKITTAKMTAWDNAESNAKSYADGLFNSLTPISADEIDALFAVAGA